MTRKSAPCPRSPLAMSQSTGVGPSPVPSISAAIRDGIFGLLSTSTCRWSASSRAGVRATRRCMKSTVAWGPMPPMTPTIFSPTRAIISDIAGQAEDVGISTQGYRAAGVQEHHVAVLGEEAFLDLVDQAIHPFAAIDRVEKNAFGAGQQFHGFDHSRRGDAIARTDVIGICHDVLALDDAGRTQMVRGAAGQIENRLFLFLLGRAHADAQHRNSGV